MRRVLAVVAATAMAMALAACSQEPTAPAPTATPAAVTTPPEATSLEEGGVFYSYIRRPSSIDPGRAVEAEDLSVVSQVFDSLTAAGENLNIVPAVAEGWESNKDASIFTFTLREGVTFHDGRPVTAADFKRAWDRIATATAEPPSAAFYLLSSVRGFEQAQDAGGLSGVRAVDERRLNVRLKAPFASFPAVVSHPALAPVPPDAVEAPDDFARMPVGNGPFRMAEPWEPDGFIRVEPYEDYWGDRSQLDQVVYRSYVGDNAAITAFDDFSSGNLDFAPVPEGQLAGAVDQFGIATNGYSGTGVMNGVKLITAFYAFNTEVTPFNDPRVRRALSLLVDRESIVEDLTGPGRVAADSVVPGEVGGYEPGQCGFCAFDPERATHIVRDLDVGPIDLVFYEGAEHEVVANRIQRDVNAALGDGTLRLRPLSQGEWLEAIRSGDAGFFLYGWLAEYPSPDAFLHPLFHASRVGTDNVTRYTNPEVTNLLDEALRTKDTARRLALYQQVETRVLKDMPVVPLYHYRLARVVSERVHGFRIDPLGYVDMTAVRVEPRQ